MVTGLSSRVQFAPDVQQSCEEPAGSASRICPSAVIDWAEFPTGSVKLQQGSRLPAGNVSVKGIDPQPPAVLTVCVSEAAGVVSPPAPSFARTWIVQFFAEPVAFRGAVQPGVCTAVLLNVPFDGRPGQLADQAYPRACPRLSDALTVRLAVPPEARGLMDVLGAAVIASVCGGMALTVCVSEAAGVVSPPGPSFTRTWIVQLFAVPVAFAGAVQLGACTVALVNVPFDGRPGQLADHAYPSACPRLSDALTVRLAVPPEVRGFTDVLGPAVTASVCGGGLPIPVPEKESTLAVVSAPLELSRTKPA